MPSSWRGYGRPYSTRFSYCLRLSVELVALVVGLGGLIVFLTMIAPERMP